MAKKKKPPKESKKKGKTIVLKEDTQLNQKIIDELEELFMMASPADLTKSVNFIFYQYLFFADVNSFPNDFNHITEDFYFLQKFFAESGKGFNE